MITVGWVAAGATLFLVCSVFSGLPPASLPEAGSGIRFFDRDDRFISTLVDGKELRFTPLQQISKTMQKALLAAEDKGFYQHGAISPESITRAAFADLQARKAVQGGSTITQQLVKNLYFSGDNRTFVVKLKEAVLAIELEQKYSKDRILEAYLNDVYFGEGTYGVEEAAEKYFGKTASSLNLAESAYLAGIVNAPSRLSHNTKDAIDRQHEVLERMVEQGMITKAQADKAKKVKLSARHGASNRERFGYYLRYVQELLKTDLGQDLLKANETGLKVYTNMDSEAQTDADAVLTKGIKQAPAGVSQGALVSIDVKSGAVLAMAGGVGGIEKSPWNRAVNPHTAGSAFKPFVYLAALLNGELKPDSTIDDAPLVIEQPGLPAYAPRNFDNDYLGVITVRKALALSRNTCAVRVAQAVGPEKIVETAKAAGINSPLDSNLSLALGSSAVTPLEMASAYATLARGGVYMAPAFIRRVVGSDGTTLREYAEGENRVFSPEPVAELVDALEDVVEKGTGRRARLLDRPVAGKTGTADGARDIWFVGMTPDLVTAVWGGNDKNQAIAGRGVTGGSIMAGIWKTYTQRYYASHSIPVDAFSPPQTPLTEEVEPLHFLPEPASIFDKIKDFFTFGDGEKRVDNGQNARPRGVEETTGRVPTAQPPDAHGAAEGAQSDSRQSSESSQSDQTKDSKKKEKKHRKGFIKRLFKKALDAF